MPVLVVAALSGLGWDSVARAEDWLVRKVTGVAFARTGQNPQVPLGQGMTLPPLASVGTGANGRVMLERSSGVVVVGPSTIVQLYDPRTGQSAVIQHQGVVDLEVEKRERPHFFVETPNLAAVVKGTGFRSQVTNRDSRISVSHGIVNVTERSTGRTVDLTAGQSAATHGRDGLSAGGVGRAEVTSGRVPAASPTVVQAFASAGRAIASTPSGATRDGFAAGSLSTAAAFEARASEAGSGGPGHDGNSANGSGSSGGSAGSAGNGGNAGSAGGGNAGGGNGGGSGSGGGHGSSGGHGGSEGRGSGGDRDGGKGDKD